MPKGMIDISLVNSDVKLVLAALDVHKRQLEDTGLEGRKNIAIVLGHLLYVIGEQARKQGFKG